MKRTFGLVMGALATLLPEQLQEQGLEMEVVKENHFIRDIEALNRLFIRGVITDSENEKARRRLMKAISKEVTAIQE